VGREAETENTILKLAILNTKIRNTVEKVPSILLIYNPEQKDLREEINELIRESSTKPLDA
jgi:hypothetical protein